jgi:cephalosporin hydroxylase
MEPDRLEAIYQELDWWKVEIGTFWKGVKILKSPLDLFIVQEIIHETRPDVIVETGSYMGGSALFYADLGVEVHTIDVAMSKPGPVHPLIHYHVGYSDSPSIRYFIEEVCRGRRVMVILDSDHSKPNVLTELDIYARFVSPGCYLIVEDTHLGRIAAHEHAGNGPADALDEWLPDHPEFKVDRSREKYGLSNHLGGFLQRGR